MITVELEAGEEVEIVFKDTDGKIKISFSETEITVESEDEDDLGKGGVIWCVGFVDHDTGGVEKAESSRPISEVIKEMEDRRDARTEPPVFIHEANQEAARIIRAGGTTDDIKYPVPPVPQPRYGPRIITVPTCGAVDPEDTSGLTACILAPGHVGKHDAGGKLFRNEERMRKACGSIKPGTVKRDFEKPVVCVLNIGHDGDHSAVGHDWKNKRAGAYPEE